MLPRTAVLAARQAPRATARRSLSMVTVAGASITYSAHNAVAPAVKTGPAAVAAQRVALQPEGIG